MSRRARWLAEWRKSTGKPVFYHVISRVVDRRFALGTEEKEKFRALMRLQEKFTGCRANSYCLMDNHFHILLEVPPMADGGLSDEALLKRLSAIYSEAFVAGVAKELTDAKTVVYANEGGLDEAVAAIHKRFTYRMHDLGEFMKGLLQRFSQWFNRAHSRTGRLWEDRFKSVIVEDGVAAKTKRTRKGMGAADAERETERAGELSRGKMLRCRVRYFTDGAVIGSRVFVNEAFANTRDRFGRTGRGRCAAMRLPQQGCCGPCGI